MGTLPTEALALISQQHEVVHVILNKLLSKIVAPIPSPIGVEDKFGRQEAGDEPPTLHRGRL